MVSTDNRGTGETSSGTQIDSLGQDVNRNTVPWDVPEVEELWSDRQKLFSQEEQRAAWEHTADVIKGYSDEMVERWNAEIDTLLVFAGLFSAVLTAFNVQSYQLLQPTPTDSTMATLTAQINRLLIMLPVNSTQALFLPDDGSPNLQLPNRSAVWLNILWFSSLVSSLSAAIIGILAKQWLQEYNSGLSGTSRQIARLRQRRLNNLIKWRVGTIVALLPVFLESALALFLAGLLILLWNLHHGVAIVISVLVACLLLFSSIVTFLPIFFNDCCYISPQTVALYRILGNMRYALHKFSVWLRDVLEAHHFCLGLQQFLVTVARISRNVRRRSGGNVLTWRGREHSLVDQTSSKLDLDSVIMAYTMIMEPTYLDVATRCMVNFDSPSVIRCAKEISVMNVNHWGPVDDHLHMMYPAHKTFWAHYLLALLQKASSKQLEDSWNDLIQLTTYLDCTRLPGDQPLANHIVATLSRASLDISEGMRHEVIRSLVHCEASYSTLGADALHIAMAAAEKALYPDDTLDVTGPVTAAPGGASYTEKLDVLQCLIYCAVQLIKVAPEDASSIRGSLTRALTEYIKILHSPNPWLGVLPQDFMKALILLATNVPEVITEELVDALQPHSHPSMRSKSHLNDPHTYYHAHTQLAQALESALQRDGRREARAEHGTGDRHSFATGDNNLGLEKSKEIPTT